MVLSVQRKGCSVLVGIQGRLRMAVLQIYVYLENECTIELNPCLNRDGRFQGENLATCRKKNVDFPI